MHKNPFWLGFLGLVALLTCYFVVRSAVAVWEYSSYDSTAVIENVTWRVEQTRSDRFHLRGIFSFSGGERSTLLRKPFFYNRWSAEQYLEKLEGKGPWRVWYRSSDPSLVTLQKTFPLKECVSAAFLVGIVFYFIGLGIYVGRKQSG